MSNSSKTSNITNPKYQSTFLPKIEKTETEIKKVLVFCLLLGLSLNEVKARVGAIILTLSKSLPNDLIDRKKYIISTSEFATQQIEKFYKPLKQEFLDVNKNFKNPKELLRFAQDTKYQNKGVPNVIDYAQQLQKKIKELSQNHIVDKESKISLWQKAELDLRHEKQMEMLENLKNNGVKYAWTSSHPDCSKRCEPWQGKLFDLESEHSDLSNHRMNKKINGHQVYCFKEVINKVDKYGYKNNIIVGFNCRHRLIPYKESDLMPNIYNNRDIAKEREINAKLRAYERKIRLLLQQSKLYNSVNKTKAIYYKQKASELIKQYKAFANENNYAWYEYRIKV